MGRVSAWEALLLGVVEGLTEFLPVSSTGHLTLLFHLLGLPVEEDPFLKTFLVAIQLGAILAVLLLYGLLGTMYSFNIVYMMFGHGAGYPGEWGDLLMTNLFRNTFGLWNFGLGAAASTLYMLLSLGLILFWYRVFREDLRAR